jgi:hypothetical protein
LGRGSTILARNTEETAYFFDVLYPSAPPDAWMVISWPDPDPQNNGHKPGMLSRWFLSRDRSRALRLVAGVAMQRDLYVGVGLRDPAYPESTSQRYR